MRYLFVVSFLVLTGSPFLQACSCADQSSLSLLDLDRKYVFIGIIVSDTQLVENERYGLPTTSVGVFKPLRWYSKNRGNEILVTIRSDVGSTCGITLRTGDVYLLFSDGSISTCSRYRKFSRSDFPENVSNERIDEYVKNDDFLQLLESMTHLPENGAVDTFYAKGTMVNGMPHGIWEYEDPDAMYAIILGQEAPPKKLLQTSYYTYGMLDSTMIYSGSYVYLERYKKGIQTGWQETYKNGSLSHRYYLNEEGAQTETYQYDGDHLFYKMLIEDGLPVSYYYYGNGKLKQVGRTQRDGFASLKEYRETGELYIEGSVHEEPVAWYTRSFFYLDNYWNIKGEQVVKNGTGHLVEWWNDTLKSVDVFIQDGIFYGEMKRWWNNGQLCQHAHFGKAGEDQVYENTPVQSLSSYYYSRFAEYAGKEIYYHQNGTYWTISNYSRKDQVEEQQYYTEKGAENGSTSTTYEVLPPRAQ